MTAATYCDILVQMFSTGGMAESRESRAESRSESSEVPPESRPLHPEGETRVVG